jgi:hypothetical protein
LLVVVPGAILNPPGADGRLFYGTVAGFFTAPGRWRVRAHLKADAEHEALTPWETFFVGA